jgi:hypothetical protein
MSRTALVIASLIAVVAIAYELWPTDERAIRRRLNAVATTISVPAGESQLARIARVGTLRSYLADDIHLRNGTQEITSRDGLLAFVASFTPTADFTVELLDTHIALDADRQTAQVYTDVKMTSRDTSGAPTVDAREAAVSMANRQGEWVVTAAETRETLRRP